MKKLFPNIGQKDLEKIGFSVLRFKDGKILKNSGDIIHTIKNYIYQFEEK